MKLDDFRVLQQPSAISLSSSAGFLLGIMKSRPFAQGFPHIGKKLKSWACCARSWSLMVGFQNKDTVKLTKAKDV